LNIDPSMLDQSSVAIMGATVPHDSTNRWSLASNRTTVILNGNGCTTWRMPQSTEIAFSFACSAILF
jgi:hypothetical protein